MPSPISTPASSHTPPPGPAPDPLASPTPATTQAPDQLPFPSPATTPSLRVIAVVVTYNRRELLLESLAAVQVQSLPPDRVIVVDNASTDGTAAAVRAAFPTAALTGLAHNTGGAGGFAYGLALAIADGADLIWLMDDDTVPEPGALAALLTARQAAPGPAPALVASRVIWTDGNAHPMNTPRVKPLVTQAERAAAQAVGCQPIRSASFVSILVEASACQRSGLPQADYFLWNDDFEFTARLLRHRTGLLCPASVVVHKTAAFGGTDLDPGPRFFYEVRNKIWTLRARSPLAPLERALYTASTLRRWARTFARSADRRTLRRELRRGLAAGLRTRPRPTEEVLATFGLTIPAPTKDPIPANGSASATVTTPISSRAPTTSAVPSPGPLPSEPHEPHE